MSNTQLFSRNRSRNVPTSKSNNSKLSWGIGWDNTTYPGGWGRHPTVLPGCPAPSSQKCKKTVGFIVFSFKNVKKPLVLLCFRSKLLKKTFWFTVFSFKNVKKQFVLLCFRSNILKNSWFYYVLVRNC